MFLNKVMAGGGGGEGEEGGGCLGNHPIPLKRSCNISAHFTRCNAR